MDDSKRRSDNLSWTISRIYNKKPLQVWTCNEEAGSYEWIAAHALNGALSLYIKEELFTTWLSRLFERSADADFLLEISKIALEGFLLFRLPTDWKGTKNLRYELDKAILKRFSYRKPDNLIQELHYAGAHQRKGYPIFLDPRSQNLLKDLDEAGHATEVDRLFEEIDQILNKYFHVEESLKSRPAQEQFKIQNQNQKIHLKDIETSYSEYEAFNNIDDGPIESAEFTAFTQVERQVTTEEKAHLPFRLKVPSSDQRRKYVSERFGASILSKTAVQKIEQAVCTGLHAKNHIHITKGELAPGQNRSFYLNELEQQRHSNLEFFVSHQLEASRNIRRLQETITNTLLINLDESPTYGIEGQVFIPKLWRFKKLADPKVFYKPARENHGSLTIDLLLDASASQFERQELVSLQAFILTQAFSALGIPIAVWSFQNLYEYTVLRIYRDYKSPRSDNMRIFDYKSDGSNRDGLAIRTLTHRILSNRGDAHPILIVLSDGKPNDKRGRVDAQRNQLETEYTGSFAVKDTAIEVRRARDFGIAVLGVFTGEEEDLVAVQKIYGRNFAHIQDTDQFARVVGMFIKHELRSIIDQ